MSRRRSTPNAAGPSVTTEHGRIEQVYGEPSSSTNVFSRPQDFASSSHKPKSSTAVVELRSLPDSRPETQYIPVRKKRRLDLSTHHALPLYYAGLQRRVTSHPICAPVKHLYKRTRKAILKITEIPPSKDGRHMILAYPHVTPLLDERTCRPHISNTIRSCRYTLWNFLPRQLYAQFSRAANLYFLVIATLQIIPGLSTTGTYTTIIPVLFFVAVAMLKEGYDDFRRYRSDKVENSRLIYIVDPRSTSALKTQLDTSCSDESLSNPTLPCLEKEWHDLSVGDIVKLNRDDPVPADLLLLASRGTGNKAYIETMALDGETNLKGKHIPLCLSKRHLSLDAIRTCNANVSVEDPNVDLYKLEGKITLGDEINPLTNNEIIYRGSVLRNTHEAYGLIIYTGEECKIRMNANKSPRVKTPSIQTIVNRVILVIIVFVIILAIFNTVAYQVWRRTTERHSWYLFDAVVPFFHILVSFIIMFNTMVPLSLYVSQEIIKLVQMMLLNDIDMYDPKTNTPFEARTSNLNEELGQINYIFSDKTGTLTNNDMKFRKLSVAGTAWLHVERMIQVDELQEYHDKNSKGKAKHQAPTLSSDMTDSTGTASSISAATPRQSVSHWTSSAHPGKVQADLDTSLMLKYLQIRPYTAFAKRARMMLVSMALCHTCEPEAKENGTIEFQASSPDELAILQAAQELDYLVMDKKNRLLTLKTFPQGRDKPAVLDTYEVLEIIEFTSKRKRMSAVVRLPDKRLVLFCKGADSVVADRLRLKRVAHDEADLLAKIAADRKSLEVQEVIRRQSEQQERLSLSRPSLTRARIGYGRRSLGGLGPASTGARPQQIRAELDGWLNDHERDALTPDHQPRTSWMPRLSMGHAPLRSIESSMALGEQTDNLSASVIDAIDSQANLGEAGQVERCFQHIDDFASDGLRTLLYAHRTLSNEEFATWRTAYVESSTSAHDRQTKIEETAEMIERDLELGGAIAIEDKLQDGVPETIDKLRRANIKLWMLTGDKRETAINIGHTCRLIKDYSSIHIIDHSTGTLEHQLSEATTDVNGANEAHSVIVVDGQSLTMIDAASELHELFVELAIKADSVICCRASPGQKAKLVHTIRRRVKDAITLAIGDGANDIAMIQEAHVGIGVTGKEGLQAARSSDYSIAQFRFLSKLLLVHGRWNYVRLCKYTVATLWKETLFYLVQAFFQRDAGYTGTSLYESWSLSQFNTLFSSLTVIILGIYEQDLRPSTLIAVPELYSHGQLNKGFNFRVYFSWMFMATCEAAMIYYIAYSLFGIADFTKDNDLYALGDMAFTACIIVITITLQSIEMHYQTIASVAVLVIEIGGWWIWTLLLDATYHDNKIYHVRHTFTKGFGENALWWMTLSLILLCVLAFEILTRSIRAIFWPTDVDIFQTLERDTAITARFEDASKAELQQGWNARPHQDKTSQRRACAAAEAERREQEIQEMLSRPRVMAFD